MTFVQFQYVHWPETKCGDEAEGMYALDNAGRIWFKTREMNSAKSLKDMEWSLFATTEEFVRLDYPLKAAAIEGLGGRP